MRESLKLTRELKNHKADIKTFPQTMNLKNMTVTILEVFKNKIVKPCLRTLIQKRIKGSEQMRSGKSVEKLTKLIVVSQKCRR